MLELIDQPSKKTLLCKENFNGGMINKPGDGNTIYLLKHYNTNLEPRAEPYYSADPLVSLIL